MWQKFNTKHAFMQLILAGSRTQDNSYYIHMRRFGTLIIHFIWPLQVGNKEHFKGALLQYLKLIHGVNLNFPKGL